ncbi:MAG: hypothetical protein R3251_03110 [Candidatus Spechtbacterales bacterium]|nr:hypothetical protein [Candidatus Spechtbacterales bacterium]
MIDHLKAFSVVIFIIIAGLVAVALIALLTTLINSFVNDLALSAFLAIFGSMFIVSLVFAYRDTLSAVRSKKESNKS